MTLRKIASVTTDSGSQLIIEYDPVDNSYLLTSENGTRSTSAERLYRDLDQNQLRYPISIYNHIPRPQTIC